MDVMIEKQMITFLDELYVRALDGVPGVSEPIEALANDYLTKHATVEKAAESFINYQIAKCTTSGFVTGLGGILTLPIAIPANISSVLYVQMRMIACLAYMGGHEVRSDQVKTFVYACLAGIGVGDILKRLGIEISKKMAVQVIKKIPTKLIIAINKKVGFRLLTKFGSKGLINLGKGVPVLGGILGGAFDYVETKAIGNRAYKMFIEHDFDVQGDDIIDVEGEEVVKA